MSTLEIKRKSKVESILSPEGKARRSKCKSILLGTMYGMGPSTLADRMKLPLNEAKQIIADFYKGFPGVEKFTEESQAMARKYGYVTDLWGRRRHLPDAMLPEYEFISNAGNTDFNPLLDSAPHEDDQFNALVADYKNRLSKAKWKADKDAIIAEAQKRGITIKSNGGFISRAQRQTLNARIQGSAASMTKLAMIMIHNDEILNKLGFKLLVTVHDEVWGICPKETATEAGARLSEVMVAAAKTKCCCKFKCDEYVVSRWYSDEFSAEVLKDYNKLLKTKTPDQALAEITLKYNYIKPMYVKMMCEDKYDPNLYSDI